MRTRQLLCLRMRVYQLHSCLTYNTAPALYYTKLNFGKPLMFNAVILSLLYTLALRNYAYFERENSSLKIGHMNKSVYFK